MKVIVKSGLSPLQIHSFDLRVKTVVVATETNEVLQKLRTATFGDIAEGENATESIFDAEAQQRDVLTSVADDQEAPSTSKPATSSAKNEAALDERSAKRASTSKVKSDAIDGNETVEELGESQITGAQ